MSYTSETVGSLAQYVVPEAKWSSDLTGLVVEVSRKTSVNGASPKTISVNHVSFTGDETTEEVRAMLATAVGEDDTRFFRSITGCYLNPDFDANGLMVPGSGERVQGRYVFSPDPKVKSQGHAMQAYARVISEIKADMILTLGSRKQMVDFVTISRLSQFKGMQSEGVNDRFSFRWSRFDKKKSNRADIAGL